MQAFTSEDIENALALLGVVVDPESRTQEALNAAAANPLIQTYGVILRSHSPFVDMRSTLAYWRMRIDPRRDTLIDADPARRCSFVEAFCSPTGRIQGTRASARPTNDPRTLRCAPYA